MFYLIAGIDMKDIRKGMDTMEYYTKNDIHNLTAFTEEQAPVIWMNCQPKKACISQLVLDLVSLIPVYNRPLTVYIGKDNAFNKYFSHATWRAHWAPKVSAFYDFRTSAEQRKKLTISDKGTRYFHNNAEQLEDTAKELFGSLNFAQEPMYRVLLSGDSLRII